MLEIGSLVHPDIIIRAEQPDDIPSIHTVNEQAFGQSQEANIVDALRRTCENLVSLVAVIDRIVVGYIMFSPVTIACPSDELQGMGLGPLAVVPDYQRRGIGSELVHAGLAILQQRSCPFVIVLGHPEYYPRFGFRRASSYGIRSQWTGIPEEAFMILVFPEMEMRDISGVAYYRSEFEETASNG